MIEITFKGLDEIEQAAQKFIQEIKSKKLIAFYGEMGVGKTTFIKQLCKILNVVDTVASPTFSIINEYHTSENDKVYHFDFYRIEDIDEVYNLGYEDYFYSENYCFLEWPELVEELLPDSILRVKINILEDQSRSITFKI